MLNIGYLTSSKNKDEAYTPYYAANPIIKYINPIKNIPINVDKTIFLFKCMKMHT